MSKKRKIFMRALCLLLILLLLVSVGAPALAAVSHTFRYDSDDSMGAWKLEGSSDHWYSANMTTRTQYTSIDDARTTITAKLNSISGLFNSAADTGSINNMVKYYAQYLVYLDWAANNVSAVRWANGTQTIHTIFGPIAKPGESAVNYSTAIGPYITRVLEMRETIQNSDKFVQSDVSDAFSSIALSGVGNTVSESSEKSFIGYSGFKSELKNILEQFVDAPILYNLSQGTGASGSNLSALADSLQEKPGFKNLDIPGAIKGEYSTELVELVKSKCTNNTEVRTALDLMGAIVSCYDEAWGRCLPKTDDSGQAVNDSDGRLLYTVYSLAKTSLGTDHGLKSAVTGFTHALFNLKNASDAETPDTLGNSKVEIDVSNGTLGVFANATVSAGETSVKLLDGEDEFKLSDIGYYMVAAGSTYDPFVSKSGDDSYISVLQNFIKDEKMQDDLVSAVQHAVNMKKPLFYTEVAQGTTIDQNTLDAVPLGEYHPAKLSDILAIGKNSTKLFVALRGRMNASAVDGSTYEYVQNTFGSSSDTSAYAEEAQDGVDDTAGVTEINTTKIVGIDGVSASATQVTTPLAIVSYRVTSAGWELTSTLHEKLGGLTAVVLNNAVEDARGNKRIANADSEMLFINGLGDIVLDDGTIVLPALANPVLYDYDGVSDTTSESESDTDTVTVGSNTVSAKQNGYYPYTVALCNHYPSVSVSLSGEGNIGNTKDEGKLIFLEASGHVRVAEVTVSGTKNSKQVGYDTSGNRVADVVAGNSFSVTETYDTISMWSSHKAKNKVGDFWAGIGTLLTGNAEVVVHTFATKVNGNGIEFFPLQVGNSDISSSYIAVGSQLTTSAVRYISEAGESVNGNSKFNRTSTGRFNIETFISDFMGEALLGNQYSEVMSKEYKLDYEELVNNQYGRFTNLVMDVVVSFLDAVGSIDGVLAMKNGYENGFFNSVMKFVQEFYVIIAAVLIIILAVKFIRGQYNIAYILFIGGLVFASFQVYAVWMPTALPGLYNFGVNDVVEDLTWRTIVYKAEQYDETYRDSSRVDAMTGEPKPYTATIDLYRMTQTEMDSVCDKLGVDPAVLKTGEAIYLDENAGIFVKGNAIKMSVDKLLVNNTMRGLYKSQWEEIAATTETGSDELINVDEQTNDNPYIIKLTAPYVSLESYYTPFCQFERAFIVNLNQFSSVFRIARHSWNYGGIYKDSFMFNQFTNSGVFTNPELVDEELKQSIRADSLEGDLFLTVDDIVARIHDLMNPFEDWLNLDAVFKVTDPSGILTNESLKTSLWGQMLQRNGYYGPNWEATDEYERKLNDLILYINNQTKKFIVDNGDMLNYCSDENAIKLVSLYATTCFTHRVSEFGYWLYPNYVNAADIELRDVMYGTMTALKERNASDEANVVSVVAHKLGLPGLIMMFMIILLSTVFVFALSYLIPILYLMLGVLLVFKLLNDQQGATLVSGYFKVTLVTILLYLAYSFGLRTVQLGGYQWYGYLACTIITALCVYFLAYVCIAVIRNPLEMANDFMFNSLFSALNRLTGNRLSRLNANSLNIMGRDMRMSGRSGAYGYMHGTSIDDRGSYRRPKRGEHYGRWSDFDDETLSTRARVISRFGEMGRGSNEVGNTMTGFRRTKFMGGVRKAGDAARRTGRAVNHVKEHVGAGNKTRNTLDRFSNFKRR